MSFLKSDSIKSDSILKFYYEKSDSIEIESKENSKERMNEE